MAPEPPRYLVRLSGITARDGPATVSADTAQVQAVRTGLHDTARGPELHVVLDLARPDLEVSLQLAGTSLELLVTASDAAPDGVDED